MRDYTGTLLLSKVRLNQGGYDERGRYYGVGEPLYRATDMASFETISEVRAKSRDHAKQLINLEYPLARFFR